jgi:hypothetical protein
VSDSTPPPTSNDAANDGYEIRAAEARKEAHQDAEALAREAERDVDQKGRTVREKVSDAIEDIIPGDSDKDGH